ncbi:uncharacterized protein LOC143560607 [Bidens hawaiensis]|uniref:uncharacterized protein LOC143560607 n=1 Tax=Bidens hawaiensis TaxID=980011 RepID=UPI0040491B73
MKSNWDELNAINSIPPCTCGASHVFVKREEDQRLIQFLVGLNPNYDMIRSNILMMQPLPSIDRAYGILIQDEKQRVIHTTTTDFIASSTSMHVNTGGPVSGGNGENRRTLVCTHCKRNGHSVNKCYKLIGFPKDFKFNKGKKFAYLAEDQGTSDQSDQQGITQKLYHDLMVLLQQNKLQYGTPTATNNATTINHDSFRGPFSEEPSSSCRTTWTHLLSTKSNAFHILQSFIDMVSNQFGTTVRCIRSDNAFELGTGLVQHAYLLSKGIIHQTTCVAVPQQNGIVERKHKHLLETSRALMFQSKLPVQFWGDCGLTATNLINRFPTEILNNKTPYEVLTGKLPSYDHIKSFGCLAYPSTLSHGRDKFKPKAVPCVFLGYPLGKKAY